MPRNRFNGSEAPDYPKGKGRVITLQTDQACVDMLKSIAQSKSMTYSQVFRELVRQEQRIQGLFVNSYQVTDNQTGDLFQ